MDSRRGNRPVLLRYRWQGDNERGRLTLTHEAALEDLGFRKPKHPFIEVTGPVVFEFDHELVRDR